jgi:hypothetical protein
MDPFLGGGALGALIILALFGVQQWVGGYTHTKGVNQATVEGLDEVGRKVEALQSQFRLAVEKAVTSHGQRLAVEIEIYREAWDLLLDLEEAADQVWYDGIRKRTSADAYRSFQEDLKQVQRRIKSFRPFFPKQMQGALMTAELHVRKVAAEMTALDFKDSEAVKSYLSANLPEVWAAFRELEDSIRRRLWDSEDELQELLGPNGGDDASSSKDAGSK